MSNTQTFETSKTEKYNVASIIKKMENCLIRFDHPGQRMSDQWVNRMKSNLISDILQGNPIPPIVLAEQIIDGISITWNLDGKQRCSNIYNYVHDGFKITSSVTRNIIRYQTIEKDENGTPVLENGVPKYEWKEFNIINKKFSQLPEELQDKILDYCIDATLYLNCSSEDIMYHITRYNDGKAMNKSQKSITRLGEEFAKRTKDISNMDFFVDHCTLSKNANTNGTTTRLVTESIIATNFADSWNKDLEKACKFIDENATDEMFDELEDTIERLDDMMEDKDETEKLFNTKNGFIWISIFNKHKDKIDDENFKKFLTTCVRTLNDKKLNGISFNEIDSNRNTKDKLTIKTKLSHIELMLNDFLGNMVA